MNPMDGFQKEKLQNFVDDGEKDHPPVFAGRDDILQHVLTKIQRTGARKAGIPGNTTVIQGAPGAGKSSLLSELEIRAPEVGGRVVKITNVLLRNHPSKILQKIAFAARAPQETWREALRNFGSRWGDRIGRISVLGMSTDLQRLMGRDAPASFSDLQSHLPSEKWQAPILLAIDEAQRLPPGESTAHAEFLQTIHDADDIRLPIALVLAGLGDTYLRLRSLGLTHGVTAHSLERLTAGELDALTGTWCAHFGITVGAQRHRIDDLMASTDGWPRHVHWAQQALAEALLQESVYGVADRIEDWEVVHGRSNQLRRGYYDAQFSDAMVASCKLVGRVMLEVARTERRGAGLTFGQVKDVVETYKGHDTSSEWRLPKNHDEETYVTHLIHCGALQRQSTDPDDHVLTCPIPSFQSYIIGRGGFEAPL
ncbi:MAG: ATP-binding protein [Aestuariivita sp.]|nr:ATP-binding protein [Aestuariivita sp.]